MKVESIEHFKSLACNKNGDFQEFYIMLGGYAKSSKRIIYYPDLDQFYIINEIDESFQEVYTSELSEKTLLVKAIEHNSLFKSIS